MLWEVASFGQTPLKVNVYNYVHVYYKGEYIYVGTHVQVYS